MHKMEEFRNYPYKSVFYIESVLWNCKKLKRIRLCCGDFEDDFEDDFVYDFEDEYEDDSYKYQGLITHLLEGPNEYLNEISINYLCNPNPSPDSNLTPLLKLTLT